MTIRLFAKLFLSMYMAAYTASCQTANRNGTVLVLDPPTLPSNEPSVYDLKLNASDEEVDAIMEGYEEIRSDDLLLRYNERLGFLKNAGYVKIWLYNRATLKVLGGETYVIAVFDEEKKLEDLFEFIARSQLFPLLRSNYENNLRSAKKGDNLAELRALVGAVSLGRYYRDDNGAWRVELDYYGVDSEVWTFVFDAGSGIISDIIFLVM